VTLLLDTLVITLVKMASHYYLREKEKSEINTERKPSFNYYLLFY